MNAINKNWIGYTTIFMDEFYRLFRIWTQTLLPQLITISLYFIIFGHIIGPRVGAMENYNYVQFIAPGLVMLAMINSSYLATVSSFFLSKFQRSIEEILVSPLSEFATLMGYISSGVFRGIVIGLLISIVTIFFTRLHIHSIIVIIFVALLATIMFSLAGFINAVFAKKFDDIAIVPTFILTPLTYLGGVFYSINLLPPFWHYVSLFNPIFYIVSAFRFGFLGIDSQFLMISFMMMILFNVGLFICAYFLLKSSVGLRE